MAQVSSAALKYRPNAVDVARELTGVSNHGLARNTPISSVSVNAFSRSCCLASSSSTKSNPVAFRSPSRSKRRDMRMMESP